MQKKFFISFLLSLSFFAVKAQLLGINPNNGIPGQTLNTTITGNNIFIQTGSPTGNLYEITLWQGSYSISVFDINNMWNYYNTMVWDPNTVTTDVIIPGNAPLGLYDLSVTTGDPWYPWMSQQNYYLPGAFMVGAPDGYINGTVYDDLNRNGVQDAGEPGLANLNVIVNPGNNVLTTDASGNYTYAAINGSYTVSYAQNWYDNRYVTGPTTIPVTINSANSPPVNFGLKRALISITPDFGYKGTTSTYQIVSDVPIFSPGTQSQPWGNISQVYIYSSPGIYVSSTSSFVAVDSFTMQMTLTIPPGTATANNIDIRVYLAYGQTGYHYLKQKFDILPAQATISGTAFYDSNQNKILDPGEPGINGAKFLLLPDSAFAFADAQGNFQFTTPGGWVNLSYQNNIPGLTLFTDSSTYTFNAIGNIAGKNFGFISTTGNYNISVRCVHLFARCNSDQYVSYRVRNNSDVTYNAQAWIKFDPQMTFVSSTLPSTVSNDTVYFSIPNFQPYAEVVVYAKFSLPGAGNLLHIVAGANSLDGGGNIMQTDEKHHQYWVFCACDPNDKQVEPPGVQVEHFTLMNDLLNYQIQFQNTGNDTAIKVVVIDTLASDINLNTVEITGSSHSVKTQLNKNGMFQFVFNNIMLPDSNVNELMSHGFVTYTARVKSGLPDSTEIHNTAHIFFDFNPDVVTNTTLNTMVYNYPVDPLPVELASFTGNALKNHNLLQWTTYSEVNNDYFVVERSSNGYEFSALTIVDGHGTTSAVSDYNYRDYDISNDNYFYRLKQVDYDGASEYSKIILVKRNSDSHAVIVSVYPNPFTDRIELEFSDVIKSAVTVELYSVTGKNILQNTEDIISKDNIIDLTDKSIASGIYMLKVTSENESRSFRIFKR